MAIIDEYWSGVLQRLQAEVAIFNRLIMHQGERGRENEQALARVLEGLVPGRLGVGTGLLFDVNGKYSKQTDIVLYDQVDSPTVLAQTTQLLHPVEEVVVCIEVKTTLDKEAIKDAGAKRLSVMKLERAGEAKAPLFLLFAYNAETSPLTLGRNLLELDEDCRPDLTCVLDPGIIGTYRNLLDPNNNSNDEYVHGVTLLHELDASGRRNRGQYVKADSGQPAPYEQRAGALYPVVEYDSTRYLSDPSRALLLFCEILVRSIAARAGHPRPVLSRYLQQPYRDLETAK